MIIDLSPNNPPPFDFVKAKAAGVTGAMFKLTEGAGGPGAWKWDCKELANRAIDAGLLVGYYHFATIWNAKMGPGGRLTDDATNEAAWFYQCQVPMPNATLRPYLDTEDITNRPITLTRYEVQLWIQTWLGKWGLHTQPASAAGLYGNRYWFDSHLPPNHALGAVPLWVAQYLYTGVPGPNDKPTLPIGWTSCALWQFTERGSVPGITGTVDLSLEVG